MGFFDFFKEPDYVLGEASFAGRISSDDREEFGNVLYLDTHYLTIETEVTFNKETLPVHWLVKLINPAGKTLIIPYASRIKGYTYEFKMIVDRQVVGRQRRYKFAWMEDYSKPLFDMAGDWTCEIYNNKGKLLSSSSFEVLDKNERYASQAYMKIMRVEFANIDNDGNILMDFGPMEDDRFDTDTHYLKPRLHYIGMCSEEKEVILNFRIKGPNNKDCKFHHNYIIKPGQNTVWLSGWGNDNAKSYREGEHSYQILYEGKSLYYKEFRIKGLLKDKNYIKMISLTAYEKRDAPISCLSSNRTIDGFRKSLTREEDKHMHKDIYNYLDTCIPEDMACPQKQKILYSPSSVEIFARFLHFEYKDTEIYLKLIDPDTGKTMNSNLISGYTETYSLCWKLEAGAFYVNHNVGTLDCGAKTVSKGHYHMILYTINGKGQLITLADEWFQVA